MKSVYVIHVDLLDEVEKPFGELTDEEVIALCKTDKEKENYDWFESVEAFAAAFNTEECFSQNMAYMRIIDDDKDSFSITSVSREDLDAAGFDTSNVDDDTMERLADKMGDAYVSNGFWIDLPIIAEYLEIPKKENNENQEEDEL